jgi:glycosyltransferase involved in cell wall biosynthesis
MKGGVLHLIDSGGFYGAEAVILNLCIGMKDMDIQPTIACFFPLGKEKPELGVIAEKKGINVRYVPMQHKFDLKAVRHIHTIMEEEDIMILHSHGYKPSIYSFLLHIIYRIPYIVTCHLWSRETLRFRFYILLERIAMRFAQYVVAVSHPIADEIRQWKMNRQNVLVINNGIDIDRYADKKDNIDPLSLRNDLGLKQDSRLVGTIGRLVSQKAQHLFIEAARRIYDVQKDVEFLLIGDGPLRDYLQELVKQKGLEDRFHFLGFRTDVIQILGLFDIFVLCSVDEGLPIVILEAMSLSIPIVTSDVGELPSVITNGSNGILFQKGDVSAMTRNILDLLDNPNHSEMLGKNAKTLVRQRFSLLEMTQRYYDIYKSIKIS